MIILTNASPLIYLGKIGALHLLPTLFSQIITTKIVQEEVLLKEAEEFTVLNKAFREWINIVQDYNTKIYEDLLIQLHPGEASVLAVALSQRKNVVDLVILDDDAARSIGESLNLKIIGTIGVIFEAISTKKISIDEGKKLLTMLFTETDFRASSKLIAEIYNKLDQIKNM